MGIGRAGVGERNAFGMSWLRVVRLWSGVVLAGLVLNGMPLVAAAEVVVATPPGTFTVMVWLLSDQTSQFHRFPDSPA